MLTLAALEVLQIETMAALHAKELRNDKLLESIANNKTVNDEKTRPLASDEYVARRGQEEQWDNESRSEGQPQTQVLTLSGENLAEVTHILSQDLKTKKETLAPILDK